MKKRESRTVLKINEKIKIDSGIKAYRDGFITAPDRLAKFVETIMRMYLDGKLDGVFEPVEDYTSSDVTRTTQPSPSLKHEFANKAYEDGLIKNPRYVARLVEHILTDYLEGKLDKILSHE